MKHDNKKARHKAALPSVAPAWERRSGLIALLLLTTIAWAVFGRSLSSPFVFDDYESVLQNSSIVRLWPLTGQNTQPGPLTPAASSPVAGRPVVNLSFAVNYALGGTNPAGYRAANILIHLAAALLLFLVVRRVLTLPALGDRFTRDKGALALATSLIWAVHPLQTEAVVYVSQRTELLVALCYLGTIYSCLRYWSSEVAGERARWAIIGLLVNLAGMASKEVMVTAPVVALLLDRTLRSGSFKKALRDSWQLYCGLAVGWALLLYLNVGNPRGPSAGFGEGLPAHVWWFTQAKAVFIYLGLAVWPNPLSIHYAPQYLRTFAAALPWVVAVTLLVAASAVFSWRKHPAGLAGAWMLLILSPTLVVPITTEMIAERRMYLPLAGVVLLAVAGVYDRIVRRSVARGAQKKRGDAGTRRRQLFVPVCGLALLLLVMCVASARRLDDYRSNLALWQSTVAAQPEDAFALYNLGVANMAEGQTIPAIEHLQAAITHDSSYAPAYIDLAVALHRAGRPTEAIPELDKAIQLAPNDLDAEVDDGMMLSELGRYAEAAARFDRAHVLAPRDLNVLVKLVDAEGAAGHAAEARQFAQQTVSLARALGDDGVADQVQAWLTTQLQRARGAGPPKG